MRNDFPNIRYCNFKHSIPQNGNHYNVHVGRPGWWPRTPLFLYRFLCNRFNLNMIQYFRKAAPNYVFGKTYRIKFKINYCRLKHMGASAGTCICPWTHVNVSGRDPDNLLLKLPRSLRGNLHGCTLTTKTAKQRKEEPGKRSESTVIFISIISIFRAVCICLLSTAYIRPGNIWDDIGKLLRIRSRILQGAGNAVHIGALRQDVPSAPRLQKQLCLPQRRGAGGDRLREEAGVPHVTATFKLLREEQPQDFSQASKQ